jgi:hypothetical protein
MVGRGVGVLDGILVSVWVEVADGRGVAEAVGVAVLVGRKTAGTTHPVASTPAEMPIAAINSRRVNSQPCSPCFTAKTSGVSSESSLFMDSFSISLISHLITIMMNT